MTTKQIDPQIETKIRAAEIRDNYGVSESVARRLWREFGMVGLQGVDRDRLQRVRGVGPATAERINPPRSPAFRAREREVDDGVLIPLWNSPGDTARLPEENPEWLRDRVRSGTTTAARLRDVL